MSENVAQKPSPPALPEIPAPIQAPTIVASIAQSLESPLELLKRHKEVAKAVKQLVRANKALKVMVEGKPYPVRAVWQFCAACFGVTAMVTGTEEIISDAGDSLGFVSVAHAINAQGRVISGAEAACMFGEHDWQGKPSFQLRSMAQTRSTSKALSNLFADVITMAGLCPTPAEEMGYSSPSQDEKKKTEWGTPCYGCGGKVSVTRAAKTKGKYGKSLCVSCEKKEQTAQGEKILNPINDPKFVQQSIEQVQAKKAAQGQPIVQALEAAEG